MTKAELLAQARLHESLAKLGNPGGDGQTTVSFGVSGGKMHKIDPEKHRAYAKQLRAQASRMK